MDERPIEQLTLRELFGGSERLVRELTEHLEQSFLPRLRAADDLVRSYNKPAERNEIPDTTVRSRIAALLGSDDFSQRLFTRLERHLTAIDDGAKRAVSQRDVR
ncbi:MAG TPA: hypothetical protein VL475_07670 [Planctomycetaceae bacterium]|nr:hypothetical protein [Planctomycetaceae bacterium]